MNSRILGGAIVSFVAGAGLVYAVPAHENVVPILRAGAIELVDKGGQVRAQIDLQGDDVVLRLRDADGAIRVKLAASQSGSGLLLLDESTEPGVHMIAKEESTIALRRGGAMNSVLPAREQARPRR